MPSREARAALVERGQQRATLRRDGAPIVHDHGRAERTEDRRDHHWPEAREAQPLAAREGAFEPERRGVVAGARAVADGPLHARAERGVHARRDEERGHVSSPSASRRPRAGCDR
ncbi:MAG: hypothetical protein QM820_06010 [Minicystis sp.]